MSVVVYPTLTNDSIRLILGWIEKRCTILTKKYVFIIHQEAVNATDLTGRSIVWIGSYSSGPLICIDGHTQVIMDGNHNFEISDYP